MKATIPLCFLAFVLACQAMPYRQQDLLGLESLANRQYLGSPNRRSLGWTEQSNWNNVNVDNEEYRRLLSSLDVNRRHQYPQYPPPQVHTRPYDFGLG